MWKTSKDKETPEKKEEAGKESHGGGIGSSAWRRRLEESALQKLGLSKAEKDENTGDVDGVVAAFRATTAELAEVLKKAESYRALCASADEALVDFAACYGDDEDGERLEWGGSLPEGADDTKVVLEGLGGGELRRARGARLKGWACGPVASRAGKGCENPNFKGSYLGRSPLVSADFWTSDHLSERFRSVNVVSGTRARGTPTLKRR